MIEEQTADTRNHLNTPLKSQKKENPLTESELTKLQDDLIKLENERWDHLLQPLRLENPENAVKIMVAFVSGVTDLIKSVRQRGHLPVGYKLPAVLIKDTDDGYAKYGHNLWQYTNGSLEVIDSQIKFPKKDLRQKSNKILDLPYPVQATKGLVQPLDINIGTPEEIAYTTGAEEAAHSIFAHQQAAKGIIGSGHSNTPQGAQSVHHYDASDVEYHGLGWQVRTLLDKAKKINLGNTAENSPSTESIQKQIDALRYRIRKAAELRSKH